MTKSTAYFVATVAAGLSVAIGSLGLAVKGFYPAYQSFLEFCGVAVATCEKILNYLSPVSVIASALVVWLVVVFLWQLGSTLLIVGRISRLSYARPNYLEAMILRLSLAGRVKLVPGYVLFCSGILAPKIVIGEGLLRRLSLKELEAALRHEIYHLKNRDPLKVLLVNSFSRAFFFLPAVGELGRSYLKEKELAADRMAEKAVGRVYLGRALYKVLAGGNPQPSFLTGLTPNFAEAWRLQPDISVSSWVWPVTLVILTLLLAFIFHPTAAVGACL